MQKQNLMEMMVRINPVVLATMVLGAFVFGMVIDQRRSVNEPNYSEAGYANNDGSPVYDYYSYSYPNDSWQGYEKIPKSDLFYMPQNGKLQI